MRGERGLPPGRGRTQRERKRMVGLLIEDVTLTKAEQITAHVRFRGGATTTLTLPLPLNSWQRRTTPPAVLAQIDALLCDQTDAEVARTLNERGLTTGTGAPFTSDKLRWLRNAHGMASLKQHLRAAGWLDPTEYAAILGVHPSTVKAWLKKGLVRGRVCDGSGTGSSIGASRSPLGPDQTATVLPKPPLRTHTSEPPHEV